jgi:hypothetical protein
MKAFTSITTLLALTALLPVGEAFQFMKNWKMPTYDPNAEAVAQKFADKSTFVRSFVRSID